jgi:uncharacterized protein YcfL
MVGRKNFVLVILSVFLIVIGCSTTNNGLDDENSNQLVQYFVFNRQEVNSIVVDTVEFNLIVRKNREHSIFEYKNDNRQEIYEINFFDSTGFMVHSNDTVILHFLDKSEIVLFQTNDTTTIYKFISLNPVIDNANYLYFTPKLGLVLKKSTTWPIFSELSRHYLDKEYTFNLLLSLVYNEKNFHNGIQPEMPPPAPTNY